MSNGQIGIEQVISTPVPLIDSITTERLLHNNYLKFRYNNSYAQAI